MKISLKNITRIKEAEVFVDGITIIAGENNSGKSTVGRIIYNLLTSKGKVNSDECVVRIKEEFDNSVLNFNADENGAIDFKNEDFSVSFLVKENLISANVNGKNDYTPIYIDDPHILDIRENLLDNLKNIYPKHRLDLYRLLSIDNPNKKGSAILEEIRKKTEGELLKKDGQFFYKTNGENVVDIKNTSSGLKTLLILERLLSNGLIGDKTILILDEPEIHLHPEWQILLSRFIVYANKTLKAKVLLNTHSPYLLNAIEVYSQKQGVYEDLKFYFSENKENVSTIYDYTDRVELIYKRLVSPFLRLDEEAYGDD